MKILITGGSGNVGRVLCQYFLKQGYQLRVLALPSDSSIELLPPEVECVEGDISDPISIEGICQGIDVVYHLAAIILAPQDEDYEVINHQGTRNVLAEAKKCDIKQFIYISSASVVYPELTPYGKSKLLAEHSVKESLLTYTIVRPTLVFDETGSLEYNLLLQHLQKWTILPLPGGGISKKRPIYAPDLCDGLYKLALNPVTFGKTYALAGAETLSFREMCELSIKLGHYKCSLWSIPLWLARLLVVILNLLRRKPVSPQQALAGFIFDADLDISLASQDLDFKPKGFSEILPHCFPRRSLK